MSVLLVYRGIAALIGVLLVSVMFGRRSLGEQVTAGIVLVPLLLRVLLIK